MQNKWCRISSTSSSARTWGIFYFYVIICAALKSKDTSIAHHLWCQARNSSEKLVNVFFDGNLKNVWTRFYGASVPSSRICYFRLLRCCHRVPMKIVLSRSHCICNTRHWCNTALQSKSLTWVIVCVLKSDCLRRLLLICTCMVPRLNVTTGMQLSLEWARLPREWNIQKHHKIQIRHRTKRRCYTRKLGQLQQAFNIHILQDHLTASENVHQGCSILIKRHH